MKSLRTYVAITAISIMCSNVVSANDAVIAQKIAGKLRTGQQANQLQGFQIRVNVEDGKVWLKGEVGSDAQRQLALGWARRVPGVKVVVNDLRILPVNGTAPAAGNQASLPRAAVAEASPLSRPVQPAMATAASVAPGMHRGVPTARPMARPMPTAAPIIPRPVGASRGPQRMASLAGHVISDRAVGGPGDSAGGCYGGGCYGGSGGSGGYSEGGGYGGGGYDSSSYGGGQYGGGQYGGGQQGGSAGNYDSPNMPGYAWPSYASHPNYAALTYPQQYSPTAWPYIGPFYPYPQVPLGWRKVALEWDDGWWFLDFSSK